MGGAASRTGDETGAPESARDPDFSGHATGELERARRELAASTALAVPGSGAHLMAVRQAQAIDAELAARRRGPSGADGDRAVDALRLAWGDEYDIGFADGAYHAARLDGSGDLLRGRTPDELAAAIRAGRGARSAR